MCLGVGCECIPKEVGCSASVERTHFSRGGQSTYQGSSGCAVVAVKFQVQLCTDLKGPAERCTQTQGRKQWLMLTSVGNKEKSPDKACTHTHTTSLTRLRQESREQPVMDWPGCAAMPCDGADASTSTCFLAPFFFAKRGLGGTMTGAMGPGLAILEGRPRRRLVGECLCQPG